MDPLTEFDEEAFRAVVREEGRADERLAAIQIAVEAGFDKAFIINSLKYTEEEYEEATK